MCVLPIASEMSGGITLDPRLPFPDSVGEMYPGPATTQKVHHGINGFQAGGATMIDSFEHVDYWDNSR